MAELYEGYFSTLTTFSKNAEITRGSKRAAFEYLCKEIAIAMKADLVGIWLYTPEKDGIQTVCSFEKSRGTFSDGQIIPKNKYPTYFNFIETERLFTCNNTLTDPVTAELVEDYLLPHKIFAMVDAPIYFDGEMVGVLCCELHETRDWSIHDRSFVTSCADFIGRVLEADKRREYEKDLHHRIFNLENEAKKKLHDLNEAKLSLDLAMEGASLAKWDWEIASNRVTFNEQWGKRFGYSLDELPESIETFKRHIHPEDLLLVFEALDKHLKEHTPFYEAKFRMIDRAGNIQWVLDRGKVTHYDSQGAPLRAMGINIDVTTLVTLEESLKQSEEQLKLMIKSIPSSIAMLDRNLNIITFSQKWQDDWSFLGRAVVGKNIGIAYANFTRKEEFAEKFHEVLAGRVITRDEEFIEFEKENKHIWVKWELRPWFKTNGEIGGVLVLIDNITERKEAEIKLSQSAKLSALGEMAGGIAHEINNPLGIIRGYVDLMLKNIERGLTTPESVGNYVEKIGKTVDRISKIVNGMRRFSRDSSKDPRAPYSLNQLIDDTLDISQERIKNHGIFLNITKFENEPMIDCKSIEMSQVFLNLLSNSIHAVQKHSRPWIKIICKETEDKYEVHFMDSGEGLSSSIQRKLFQPFFTTKEIGEGTGLGLSISKAIVEDNHGKLFFDPTEKNTCFVIQFRKVDKKI